MQIKNRPIQKIISFSLLLFLSGIAHFSYAVNYAPVTSTSSAVSITSNSAVGRGNISDVGYYGWAGTYIWWGTSSTNMPNNCSGGTLHAPGSFSCTMTGLLPNTRYYFKAAGNSPGGTTYGSVMSFITSAVASTVSTQNVTAITTISATGNGYIHNTGGNNPTRYIEWGTTNGGPYPFSCDAGVGGTGAYSCQMTNLVQSTTYYVRAKAVNSAGTSYGSPTSFTTPAGNAVVSTVSSSNVTEYTATLSANITAIGADNPMRTIEYGIQSGIYTNECSAGTGETGQYSCNISNLTPNTTYYYRAKATNSAGTSYGSEMSFTTLALQDTTITNPNPTKIQTKASEGYFQLNSGTITNTNQVTTAVNVTVEDTIFHATFPQNTHITEETNQPFNFQNLIAQNVTQSVSSEQPTSRAAVRIGIPGEKLNFSQLVTLTVSVGHAFNGQTLDILYQQEGESTWNTHGTCTVSNGECIFTTNHATIYTINGNHQTTGDTPMNLNVEIQETLSMDCFDPSDSNATVSLGTAANPGLITAGTPAVGQSRCTVTTNADQGYYLTLTNSNPTNATLTHTDPHTGTLYEIQDAAQWNETTKTTQNWTAPTTKGLGFSVITFPEADTTHNQFDGVWNTTNNCPEGLNPDSNDYAGIPTTPQAISAVTSYQQNATTTNICYKVDVPASQPSGQYSGQVMFTATSDASGYWQ